MGSFLMAAIARLCPQGRSLIASHRQTGGRTTHVLRKLTSGQPALGSVLRMTRIRTGRLDVKAEKGDPATPFKPAANKGASHE
jgi:hypothetical protein